MEDFEYSVEISDRDWECFFAECEECNQLPPSLAGVDDSGMSDIDDTGCIFAKKVQRVDPIADFSEAARSIDGPPDCEGSPVEHYLSRHGVGGLESVLSGSEEDIHLRSVNVFFERLKDVREAEQLTEPGKRRAEKNTEVIQEEEWCSDGQKASSRTLPKNIPKLNSLPARGETAVGKETTEPVDTISNINTKRKDERGSNIFTEPAASNSVLKTNKSAHPETKSFITEEACTETRANEATRQNQSHDSTDKVVCSDTTSPIGKAAKVETCTPLDDIKQEYVSTSQLTVSEKCCTDSWSHLEKVANVKWEEEQYPTVIQPDATSTNKTASQESSPSASVRRRRKKKRRLSVEPTDGVQALVKQSDSEEEQYTCRGGTCQSEDVNIFYSNELQKSLMSSLYTHSATINVPVVISTKETKVNDISQVGQGRCKATCMAENNTINDRSVTALSQTVDSTLSAPNNTGNVARNLQPCSTLQVEESTGLNIYPGLPVSITDGITGRSDRATRSQSDKINYCVISCEMNNENEQNPETCIAEVRSITQSILPSAVSSGPIVEVGLNDKLSAAKSVLAAQAGNTGRDSYTVCQREAEPQQQLEIDCHYTDQNNCTLEKTHYPLSVTGTSSSDAHNTKPRHLKTRASLFLEEISHQVDSAKLTLGTSTSLPDKACLSSLSSLDTNITAQQTEHLIPTLSKFNGLPEENSVAERAQLAPSRMMAFCCGNPCLSSEMDQTDKSRRGTKSSMSELTSPSDITSVSSCCTLDSGSVTSLSNENITDMSGSSPLSVSQNDAGGRGEKTSLTLATREERDGTPRPESQFGLNDTTDSKCDVVVKAEGAITACTMECELEKAPDSKPSVFAMSSFWTEMEKLTINDILGLRMIDRAAPTSSLPSLLECEEMDMLSMNDSSFSTQLGASKCEQTNEDMSSSSNSEELSSGCVTAVDSSPSRGVMWESEAVPTRLGAHIYPENMTLTSVSRISQPALPGSPQTCLRKISKNVSVRNLRALESESFSYTWKGQALQTLDKAEIEKGEYLPDAHMPKQAKDMDCLASSSTDSYRISLTDIFQYLFGGKQSISSQAATDNITSCYIDGNSVPETYDHFFSEFDTESFFYPLITKEDQAKDMLVPIFSYSRSANRNLQFPEAYDYFFPSSSSDDESDDEDNCGPVRVVTRFNQSSSASQIFTDIYENFFTDSDLRQNFFWRTTFSFRNINFTGSKAQKQTLSNPLSRVPVSQSRRSLRRTIPPINALGNQDVVFSDPFLFNLEDRISRQLAQQPFRYEDLQMAISNPRLDASLVPLRQSDMCLLCIAFASWVLKTANPQVGDAWKAVLLANVSALSAIRYLRKYVKLEANASERKLLYTAPSES